MSTATAPNPIELAKQAVGRLTAIATLPEVTAKIIATVEDPKSSAAQLQKIVSYDPALVTRVLKVVNSAFYGLPGQVGSIERAIVLLGLNAVKNIAVAASLGQMFRGNKLCDGYSAKDLWTHSVGVAVIARELAKRAKLPVAEEAFLGGMIHDIGLLVSLQTWPEQLRNVCEQAKSSETPFVDIELTIIGVDHQTLGRTIAERWQFPQSCQDIAGNHHHPEALTGDSHRLVALVHIADVLVAHAKQGFPLTVPVSADVTQLASTIGIPTAVLDAVRNDLATIISSASALV